MPKTGVKNRTEYFNRIIEQDEKRIAKDSAYAQYIQALRDVVEYTNEIYNNGGVMTGENLSLLVQKYLVAAKKGNEYKSSSKSKARANLVNHINKIISKDLAVFNGLDKENPGSIDEAFEQSRYTKVVVDNKMEAAVAGGTNTRFAVKTADGKKGYFTARSDAAQVEKWDKLIAKVKELGGDKKLIEKLEEARKEEYLQGNLQIAVFSGEFRNSRPAAVMVALGLDNDVDAADLKLMNNEQLSEQMTYIADEVTKLMGPVNINDRLGSDPYVRNDNKNVAMYDVAKLLGCEKIIAKAVPMTVVNDGKVLKGTFMEHAEGSDIMNPSPDDPMWQYDKNYSAHNKSLYTDLADMQVLDYICGNIDRHKGNMIYKTEVDQEGKTKITGVIGIDNDASFPDKDILESEFSSKGYSQRIFKPEDFRYVTRKTADMVKNLTREQLETVLRGSNISSKAIEKAWQRTLEVKDVLNDMEKHNISYADDIEDKVYEAGDKNNPFYTKEDDEKEVDGKRSIFYDFNGLLNKSIREERTKIIDDQKNRFWKKREKGKSVNGANELDKAEYAEFINEKNAKNLPAETEKATEEMVILIDNEKIKRMETIFKAANRLKNPSEEFAEMRDTLYTAALYSNDLAEKVKSGEEIKHEQYKIYNQTLQNLNKATKNYIQKKALQPKTGKGVKRLEMAFSLENRVEELLDSFELNIGKHLQLDDKQEEKEL